MKNIKFLIMLTVFFTFGCSKNVDNSKEINYQEKLKEYGVNYYETYEVPFHKGKVVSTYEVSLYAMQTAIDNADATYDLTYFANCNDKTKIILQLDNDGKVIGYEYVLDCSKE